MIHRVHKRKAVRARRSGDEAAPVRKKKVRPTPVRKKRVASSEMELPPDFDKLGRGYGVWLVQCKATGKSYEAGFDDWNKKHGFVCIKCEMEQPMDCPDHTVTHVARKA